MDVPLVIRQRLEELGAEQRALATAAQVTESYISQLLTRKKAPPAPNRTDIYDKMETFLKLQRGELSKLVTVLEFLDTDIFNLSIEHCVAFLDPLIESWGIDLATFDMEVVLNRRLAPGPPKKFGFVEREPEQPFDEEPGLKDFLQDPSLSGDATEEEIAFLKKLRFGRKRPAPLYYYRELQNLRDRLHFRTTFRTT